MQKCFNQYYLTERIGSKPLRSVYLAHHVEDVSHNKVLLKVFDVTCLALGLESERFLHQVEWIKQLRHTNIVPILDLGVERGQPYVVSQYLWRGSLRQYLDSISPQRLSFQEALKIISQVGQALSYFHAHAHLHENVKPENVFFNEEGEVLLADFRLSGFLDVTILDYQSDPRTMCYMAPEQFAGSAGQKSDQYALACLAYELIAGRVPFSAQSYAMMWASHYAQTPIPLSILVPDVPETFEKALSKAMAKDPSERYANISAFLLALEGPVFTPVRPITKPLVLSTLDPFSASKVEPLENMASNAPIETSLLNIPYGEKQADVPYEEKQIDMPYGEKQANISYGEKQADISYEGSLASAPFGANLTDISFGMGLMGTSYGMSMVGVPYGTSLTGNPFEKSLTESVKSIRGDTPEKNLEEMRFEMSLPVDNTFMAGTADALATNLAGGPVEKDLEEMRFEMGLLADSPFTPSFAGDSLTMGMVGDFLEKNLEEIPFDTSLARDPFEENLEEISIEKILAADPFETMQADDSFEMPLGGDLFEKILADDTPLTTQLLERWESMGNEPPKRWESMGNEPPKRWESVGNELPKRWESMGNEPPKRWENAFNEASTMTIATFARSTRSALFSIGPLLHYIKYLMAKLSEKFHKPSSFPLQLVRLRDYLADYLSTVQAASRRGLLLLSEQQVHLLEHCERIVNKLRGSKARATGTPEVDAHINPFSVEPSFQHRWYSIPGLWVDQGRGYSSPILWLVLIITVIVLVGGVVSDTLLTSHTSGVIKSSNVHQTTIKVKNMPIDTKLIVRPVVHPTAMPIPQGISSPSLPESILQPDSTPTPAPVTSNYIEQALSMVAKFP